MWAGRRGWERWVVVVEDWQAERKRSDSGLEKVVCCGRGGDVGW